MKANLIKDEEDLDYLHPKKTVLNVKSKNFKTPLKPMIKNILPEEDLDTKSSDDDNECVADPCLHFFDDDQMPGSDFSDPEDFEYSEDFDKEEPASTESEITFTRPSPYASIIYSLLGRKGGNPGMVLDSDSDDEFDLSN